METETKPLFLTLKEVIDAKNELNSPNGKEGRNAVIKWLSVNDIEPIGNGQSRFKYSYKKVNAAIELLKSQA